MAGIILELSVNDKGSVVVKQFTDETKKAFQQMTDGPKQAQGPMNELSDTWVALTAKVALATGAFYAVKRMIFDTAQEIASATMEIEKQSRLVGMNTDEFQKWQYVAKMSGANADEFSFGLRLLSRNMEDASRGAGDAGKYFTAMGVSVKDTSGGLRPLNDVMLNIMDKFAQWEDGPRKIAIALALFGRGGEAMVPILSKGRAGFQEFATEAQRLGFILSPDLVNKGREAEDAFKRISTGWQATKNSFAGGAKGIADVLEPVLAVINLIGAGIGKIKDFSDMIEKWKYKTGIGSTQYEAQLGQAEDVRESAEYYRNKAAGTTAAPDLDKYKNIVEEVTAALESMNQLAEEAGNVAVARQELEEKGYVKQIFWLEETRQELERYERETNDWGTITVAKQDLVESGWKKIKDAQSETDRILLEYAKTFGDTALEEKVRLDQLSVEIQKLVTLGVSQDAINKYTQAVNQNMNQTGKVVDDTVAGIANVWSSSFSQMISQQKTFSEWVKKLWLDMADYAVGQIGKMIANYLLLGSVTGAKGGTSFFGTSSGGWGGIVGGALGILGLQEGGVFNQPTPAIVGDAGPEAVVPLKGGKIPIEGGRGGGATYIEYNSFQVFADDPSSFEQKHAGQIIKVIQTNARKGGEMKQIVRSLV